MPPLRHELLAQLREPGVHDNESGAKQTADDSDNDGARDERQVWRDDKDVSKF